VKINWQMVNKALRLAVLCLALFCGAWIAVRFIEDWSLVGRVVWRIVRWIAIYLWTIGSWVFGIYGLFRMYILLWQARQGYIAVPKEGMDKAEVVFGNVNIKEFVTASLCIAVFAAWWSMQFIGR
jgi:hypothetical protein